MNEQLFWESMTLGYPNECWEWQRYSDRDGYGTLIWNGGHQRSHRVSYCLETDIDISEIHGQPVLHSCDNPSCCNPRHLWLGSMAENQQDMVNKGRSHRGQEHHNSILTEDDVKAIRYRLKLGYPQQILARAFGVLQPTISRIHTGVTWKHLR